MQLFHQWRYFLHLWTHSCLNPFNEYIKHHGGILCKEESLPCKEYHPPWNEKYKAPFWGQPWNLRDEPPPMDTSNIMENVFARKSKPFAKNIIRLERKDMSTLIGPTLKPTSRDDNEEEMRHLFFHFLFLFILIFASIFYVFN